MPKEAQDAAGCLKLQLEKSCGLTCACWVAKPRSSGRAESALNLRAISPALAGLLLCLFYFIVITNLHLCGPAFFSVELPNASGAPRQGPLFYLSVPVAFFFLLTSDLGSASGQESQTLCYTEAGGQVCLSGLGRRKRRARSN